MEDLIRWWAARLKDQPDTIANQLLHIGEEFGEVCQEWSIHTGANPRKPQEWRQPQIRKELADVAITALITMEMFGGDALTLLEGRLREVTERVLS